MYSNVPKEKEKRFWRWTGLSGAVGIPVLSGLYYLLSADRYRGPEKGADALAAYTAWFWILTAVVTLAFGVFCFYEYRLRRLDRKSAFGELSHIFICYRFLLSQLIGRDFRIKYRRSYLGILWSLLNPLFMMIIMSTVFSFVFRSDVEYFQVYLILGQVMFSFFSEATTVSTMTVVESAQLIKKVYIPKYIFPFGKTLFSFINLLISFIAVALVMLFYRVPLSRYMLYLPLVLITFFAFTLGVSLFVSALTVFMRDTRHLYTLLMTAWCYVTPIFYPVTILSPVMRQLIRLNPLYQYITFMRNIMIWRTPPTVGQMAACIGLAALSMAVGTVFFHKKQKEFILYI